MKLLAAKISSFPINSLLLSAATFVCCTTVFLALQYYYSTPTNNISDVETLAPVKNCTKITTDHSDFITFKCKDHYRIIRTRECPFTTTNEVTTKRISQDRDDLLKRQFGPDLFYSSVYGERLFSVRAEHVGECQYELRIPGMTLEEGVNKREFQVRVYLQYKDFKAWSEIEDVFHEPLNATLFHDTVSISMDKLDKYQHGFWTLPPSARTSVLEKAQSGSRLKDILPEYEYLTTQKDTVPIRRCSKSLPKSILVIGDSHSRRLFDQIDFLLGANRDNKTSFEYSKKVWNKQVDTPVTKFSETRSIRFVADPFMNKFSDMVLDEYDAVVFQFGAWPAGGVGKGHPGHWTFSHYESVLKRLLKTTLEKDPQKRVKFIWSGVMAMPVRNDGYVWKFRDWRNNGRLWYMNEMVKKVIADNEQFRTRIQFVDAFQVSEPMLETSTDKVHFGFQVMDVVGRKVLNRLGMCF